MNGKETNSLMLLASFDALTGLLDLLWDMRPDSGDEVEANRNQYGAIANWMSVIRKLDSFSGLIDSTLRVGDYDGFYLHYYCTDQERRIDFNTLHSDCCTLHSAVYQKMHPLAEDCDLMAA